MNREPCDSRESTGTFLVQKRTCFLNEDLRGSMEGWIKLHRKIATWQWASSPNHMTLFMQLLLRANHKQTKWRKEVIEAGQLLTGRKQLMDWTGLTERQIRKCLDDLEFTKEIVRKRSAKYSIITIANWNTYQSDDRETSSKRPANVQQTSTSNNVNNANNEKNNIFKQSPLSVLFDHLPQVQIWLNEGNHDTHALILGRFTKVLIQKEIPELYSWAERNNNVRADYWILRRLESIPQGQSSKQKQAYKSFSDPTPIPEMTPVEIELLKAAGQI